MQIDARSWEYALSFRDEFITMYRVRMKTAGDRRRPQATPGDTAARRQSLKPPPSPKNLSASRRRRKNVFYRCQLTALTYSLTLPYIVTF